MKLDALVDWYASLTPESIAHLRELYHEEASFRDPFNDVRGHDAIEAIFRHMFEATEEPRFDIDAVEAHGDRAWITWRFTLRLRGAPVTVDGATRLRFGADGRVVEHRDYWDGMELFAALPLLGRIVSYLKRRMNPSGATVTAASNAPR
jgi:ketosteroid isomerase-like protein